MIITLTNHTGVPFSVLLTFNRLKVCYASVTGNPLPVVIATFYWPRSGNSSIEELHSIRGIDTFVTMVCILMCVRSVKMVVRLDDHRQLLCQTQCRRSQLNNNYKNNREQCMLWVTIMTCYEWYHVSCVEGVSPGCYIRSTGGIFWSVWNGME